MSRICTDLDHADLEEQVNDLTSDAADLARDVNIYRERFQEQSLLAVALQKQVDRLTTAITAHRSDKTPKEWTDRDCALYGALSAVTAKEGEDG